MPETERTYRIGDLAARAALSRDTLRYYERLGLLEHPLRTSGGFRLYSEATLDRLQFIKRAQAVGFSLGEVREIITFAGRGSARCQQVQDLVAEKLADLDERLSELRAFRRSLASSLRECETALREQRDPACPVVERGVPGRRAPRRGTFKGGRA